MSIPIPYRELVETGLAMKELKIVEYINETCMFYNIRQHQDMVRLAIRPLMTVQDSKGFSSNYQTIRASKQPQELKLHFLKG
jgi:hypothetical protein